MATIRDIAREAQVSVSTVSLAMNGGLRVKADTRERISAIAQRLGYRATRAARSLSSGKSWIINVINPVHASGLTSGFSSKFLHGVHHGARRNGYTVSLTIVESEAEAVDAVEVLAVERASDGVILMNPSESACVIEKLRERDFAHVILGRAATSGVPSVDNDTVQVGADAARYLIKQKFTPIVFLSGPQSHTVTQDRLAGFVRAHTEFGLSVDPSLIVDSTGVAEDARSAVKALFSAGAGFGSVLALSDALAIGAMRAVREHGLGVPEDVGIMGMNNDDLTAYTDPTLSSVELNAYDLGCKAASLLLTQIESAQSVGLHQTVPHQLVIRGSTSRCSSVAQSTGRETREPSAGTQRDLVEKRDRGADGTTAADRSTKDEI